LCADASTPEVAYPLLLSCVSGARDVDKFTARGSLRIALRIQLIPRRIRKHHAQKAEEAAHGELAEDEAEEEREGAAVERHAAHAEQDQLGGPAEEDAEPHPVDG